MEVMLLSILQHPDFLLEMKKEGGSQRNYHPFHCLRAPQMRLYWSISRTLWYMVYRVSHWYPTPELPEVKYRPSCSTKNSSRFIDGWRSRKVYDCAHSALRESKSRTSLIHYISGRWWCDRRYRQKTCGPIAWYRGIPSAAQSAWWRWNQWLTCKRNPQLPSYSVRYTPPHWSSDFNVQSISITPGFPLLNLLYF